MKKYLITIVALLSPLTVFGMAQGWEYRNYDNFTISSTSPTVLTLTATSTSAASYFPYASTTMITASIASSTNLFISALGTAGTRCLTVAADGSVSARACLEAGSKWATTTNLVALTPNGGTTIGLVLGRSATTTNSLLEVNGTTTAVAFVATSTNSVSTFTNTSAANSTTTNNLAVASFAVVNYRSPGIIYATTTAWTGTTTIAMPSPFSTSTVQQMTCYTSAGTLWVDVYHTSTHLVLVSASTTQGVFGFASNNIVNPQEKWYADIGTPASSPTAISCSFKLTTLYSQ